MCQSRPVPLILFSYRPFISGNVIITNHMLCFSLTNLLVCYNHFDFLVSFSLLNRKYKYEIKFLVSVAKVINCVLCLMKNISVGIAFMPTEAATLQETCSSAC
jgi:hypothetical protein